MAFHKMNKFHWHLTEDQVGYRYCTSLSCLHCKAATPLAKGIAVIATLTAYT